MEFPLMKKPVIELFIAVLPIRVFLSDQYSRLKPN